MKIINILFASQSFIGYQGTFLVDACPVDIKEFSSLKSWNFLVIKRTCAKLTLIVRFKKFFFPVMGQVWLKILFSCHVLISFSRLCSLFRKFKWNFILKFWSGHGDESFLHNDFLNISSIKNCTKNFLICKTIIVCIYELFLL